MFPYPSGSGLHVGHPLGYIASDIVARYKRHSGFNVLHPMGFDAFGLPAEQYAIQTGQHPSITTETNIQRYRDQLNRIGFSYDWSREVQTCDPSYYRWTQWIFLSLFNSWYNEGSQKAESMETLIAHLNQWGTKNLQAACTRSLSLEANDWNNATASKKEEILQNYRLAYRSESWVNWCPALGTVLANDEIKDGFSERGGHPVVQKQMMQWSMRITAYAQRLLDGLDSLDWSDSIKESQRHWIGRSEGALLEFSLENQLSLQVFTTRPDTVFGVSFLVLSPEHPLVVALTTDEQREAVQSVREKAARRTERERMADTKTVHGAWTGAYALHPFSKEKLPIWVGDYVLSGYGTGAVMAVPAHDSRDYLFAQQYGLPIREVIAGGQIDKEAFESHEGIVVQSDFLNGLSVAEAMKLSIEQIEQQGLGEGRVQFRMRNAIFGRQRYWGEPIPIAYDADRPVPLPVEALPLVLPEVDKYLPTEEGEPPLARASPWESSDGFPLETTTMPGWAGSSWYFLRYMDPHNTESFVGAEKAQYWGQVDLYMGGAEHATGHLLYSRFWNHFFFDRGWVPYAEPFKKLVNQGMIQGVSAFVHRVVGTQTFVSASLASSYATTQLPVDIALVNEKDQLDCAGFQAWLPEYAAAAFILDSDGGMLLEREVEKMSKSKHNVVNPDAVADAYGADGLRLYEMFLGPLEQSKPWNTQGISGISTFLRRVWVLFTEKSRQPNEQEKQRALKTAHRLVHKVQYDMDHFSFNTSVSAFMIAVNEWSALSALPVEALERFAVVLSPFAPHTAEELWGLLGHTPSVTHQPWPIVDVSFLIDDTIPYPVQFNGKTRFQIDIARETPASEVESLVLAHEQTLKYIDGKTVKKVIVVPGRIVNIVVG